MTDSQSIIVSLAGPLAGVAVGLIALTLQRNDVGQQDLWSFVLLGDIIFINLGWGMINLLPILPLDGGHVMERITARIAPRSAHSLPHVISIAVAVVAAVVGYTQGYAFAALLAVMYGFVNARAIGDEKRRVIQDAAQERADAALALLSSDHPGEAIDALEAVMSTSPPPAVADRVMVGLAWALAWRMGPGDADKLGFLIGRIAGRRDTGFLGAVAAAARGANDEATALLVRGFTGESTPPPAWLVDRLMPSAGEVDLVATWIDQFSDAERHSGLGRLVASLESSGRPADANRVRSLASAPSARPSR